MFVLPVLRQEHTGALTGEEVEKKGPQKVSAGVQTSLIRNMLASFFCSRPTPATQTWLRLRHSVTHETSENWEVRLMLSSNSMKKGVSLKNIYLRFIEIRSRR